MNQFTSSCSAFVATTAPRPSMKRSHKKISFNESVSVVPICERSSMMTPAEKSRMYYSKEALMNFRTEGKALGKQVALQARCMSTMNPASSPAQNLSSLLENDSSLRGFDALLCPTRKSNKKLVIQAVLAYYKQLRDMDSSMSDERKQMALAEAYSQLSNWSAVLALRIAQNDQIQANDYDTEIMRFVTSTPLPSESFQPVCVRNIVSPAPEPKRRGDFILEEQPQKRCRACELLN